MCQRLRRNPVAQTLRCDGRGLRALARRASTLRRLLLIPVAVAFSGLISPLTAGTQPARAVTPLSQIELAGTWHLRVGDGADWSASQFDDTAWRTVVLPGSWEEQGLIGLAGPVWYRRVLVLKEPLTGSASEGWGLLVGRTRFGTVNVWVNGISVGSFGGPRLPLPVPALRVMAIPKTAVEGHDRLAVAIRVTRVAWASDRAANGGPVGDELAVGSLRDLVDRVELDRHRDLIDSLPMLLVSLVFLGAALGFSLLWMRWQSGRDYLWFGLVALGFAANTFLNSPWVFEVTDRFPLVIRLTEISGVLLPAVFIQFLWTYLKRPFPTLLRAYQGSFGLLAVAIAVSPGLGWIIDTQGLRWLWLVPLLGWGLFVVVVEVKRGNKAARSVVLPGVLLAGTEALTIVGRFVHSARPIALQPAWAFGVFVVAMALVLFDRLNRLRLQLDDRVASLALAKQALAESEQRLRLVLDSTWEVLVLWAVEGPDRFRVVTVNHAYTELLQRVGVPVDAEDLVGKSFEEVFEGVIGLSREVVEADVLRFMTVVETRRPITYEMSMDVPTGPILLEMTVCPVLDDAGRCTHILRASRDITESRRTLEELRRSEERFSKAFRSSPVPMTISRKSDGMLIDVNEALEEVSGFGRNWFIGQTSVEGGLWPNPEDRERVVQMLSTTGSIRDVELNFRSKGGEPIFARFSAATVELAGETCLLSVFLDIREQKRAEAKIKLLAQAIRSTNDCMSITDPNNRLIYVNDAFLRTYGYSESELLGKSINIVRAAAQLSPTPAAIQVATVAGGWQGELLNKRKDGSEFPIFLSSSVVRDDKGEPMGLIGVATNITERKRGEERQALLQDEIKAAATEWTETFDTVESALIVTTSDGTVRRLNVAARDLAGGEWADLVGRPLGQLGEGEPWQTAARLVEQAVALGRARAERVHDSIRSRTWALEAARFEAAPDRVITVIRDVTALIELQESLQRKETMLAMGSLVGGVAHEVRNPLFGISGLLDALDARSGRDGRFGEYFEALRRETDRLAVLMTDLLEFGRPISEGRVAVPLALVAREAVQLCRREAVARDVSIILDVPEDMPHVPMDRGGMVEVLRNLVENAVQHSPAGGKVAIAARLLEAERPGWVEVAVMDSGRGFDEADTARVFEPFFSRRSGGTGLGLSIVHRIVTAHGGEVQASNQPEGGGLVAVQLPI